MTCSLTKAARSAGAQTASPDELLGRPAQEREKQEWDAQHSALLAEHAQVIEQM